MGDFNVNIISEFTGMTPQCQQFTNIFLAHYYRKLIHLPTHVSGNSGSILDNIYTNHPLHDKNKVIITDHYSIFTVCKDPEPIVDRKFRERRNFEIKNIVKFKNKLRSVNWEEKFESGSALHNFTPFFRLADGWCRVILSLQMGHSMVILSQESNKQHHKTV